MSEHNRNREEIHTSYERLDAALSHKLPDRIPIDFGGTSVTGMHVSCVAALRDYYGLEKRPVRVHEPSQMLGLLEEDLLDAMGIDVVGVFRRSTKWGFPAERWKNWEFNGLEVLVPGDFNTTVAFPAQVGASPVFEFEEVIAHHRPTAAGFPNLARMQTGQIELLCDFVHLFAHDVGDLQNGALSQ